MLWLALHFSRLPLDTFTRGAFEPGPLAVASSAGGSATLVACNRAGGGRGIRSGMTVSAAWTLASDLKIVVRDESAERAALERIAAWAFQFTPNVSMSMPADVLLEVEGSLKLFGGLVRLRGRVEKGLAELGYRACIACAPTPLAAQWFARAGLATRIQHRDALIHELQKLPVYVLDHSSQLTTMLNNFGVHTIGECLKLPRDGVARRLGQGLLDDLDRALGKLPDPRLSFVPPSHFKASLALPAPVEQAEALLFGARRLLIELCGWLVATDKGAQTLRWVLAHEDCLDTQVDMKLIAASRDSEHLSSVLREHLARLELPRPVSAIMLCTRQLQPLGSQSLSFLPDVHDGGENTAQLIERLRARLGEEAVFGLATLSDHRPEHAWHACKPGDGIAPKAVPEFLSRPLWLLAAPYSLKEVAAVPYYDGPLSLLIGPERIETGWWDGHDVTRDYFVACNPAQSLLWIYRERNAPVAWYLHGIFG
jgi:protein ImuB